MLTFFVHFRVSLAAFNRVDSGLGEGVSFCLPSIRHSEVSVATTFYDVVPVGGQWAMKVAGHDQASYFPSQDQALNVAMDTARALWEKNGVRCVVRLQQPDGGWQRKRSFGNSTPVPAAKSSHVQSE